MGNMKKALMRVVAILLIIQPSPVGSTSLCWVSNAGYTRLQALEVMRKRKVNWPNII